MVLPSSSRHWFSPLEKVGQSRVLMTIFGRVLCPLQPSCLPPPHCARALLLSSFLIVADPIFFSFPLRLIFHRQNTTLFVPLSLSSPSYHSFPPPLSDSSCYCSGLSFLPKPASSAHPPSPRFTPLYCFLCSFPFHCFLCSPFSLLSFPSRKQWHPGLLRRLCTESWVCWPLACSGSIPVFLISPAAWGTRVCRFINVHTFSHVSTDTLVMDEFLRVLSLHLHTPTSMCLLMHAHFHTLPICVGTLAHTHTHTLHLLAVGLIAWKMNTKCRAKWLAGITLAVCSSPPALYRHETGAPPYLSLHSGYSWTSQLGKETQRDFCFC